MRLAPATVDRLPAEVRRFGYAREEQSVGIVHLGLGAFHRAHQAVYTDLAMSAGDRDWAICGVSLRSGAVRDQLVPQGGLFSVTERTGVDAFTRIIGSIGTVILGAEGPAAVIAAMAAPLTRIVSLTVTEKGYHSAVGGGLDMSSAEVADDIRVPERPRTIYGYLAAAFEARRGQDLAGITLVSCDNLAANGERLAGNLAEFLELRDPSLRAWFERECACPSTMVDRIVPATTEQQIDNLERRIGVRDHAAVMTEPFLQWVIEDRFAGPRPRWEVGGAQFVADVRPYEEAKLRLLNAAHSALAYIGLQRGHEFVHEAVADPHIAALVKQLMLSEAAPTLPVTEGLDPAAYVTRLIDRFSNSALAHRLEQIAMDGSQKIPQRWLPTLRAHQRHGRKCPAILEALSSWIGYVRRGPGAVADPMAETLAQVWRREGKEGVASAFFGEGGLFAADWTATQADLEFLRSRLDCLG